MWDSVPGAPACRSFGHARGSWLVGPGLGARPANPDPTIRARHEHQGRRLERMDRVRQDAGSGGRPGSSAKRGARRHGPGDGGRPAAVGPCPPGRLRLRPAPRRRRTSTSAHTSLPGARVHPGANARRRRRPRARRSQRRGPGEDHGGVPRSRRSQAPTIRPGRTTSTKCPHCDRGATGEDADRPRAYGRDKAPTLRPAGRRPPSPPRTSSRRPDIRAPPEPHAPRANDPRADARGPTRSRPSPRRTTIRRRPV